MTFHLAPLGQAPRASENKPVVRSILERNTILLPSASSSSTSTINIERYGGKEKKPTLLEGLVDIDPFTCTEISPGAWTYTDTQNCGKDASGNDLKCGKVTTGTVSSTPGSGVCAGSTFTYATIYYEWTAHNNQSNLSAPLNKVADTFNATWTAPDGTAQYTFNINVPVVRPDHETTVFVDWWPDNPTVGEWQQTLVPPRSDPTFDFSGESVQEQVGGAGQDTCWFKDSQIPIVLTVTGGPPEGWIVNSGNVWGPDQVGWLPMAVEYYRNPISPPTPPPLSPVPCGFTIQQQMTIKAPSDGTTYNKYGAVNVLGGSMTQTRVKSERAGKSKAEKWP